jgi:hypothetical protein
LVELDAEGGSLSAVRKTINADFLNSRDYQDVRTSLTAPHQGLCRLPELSPQEDKGEPSFSIRVRQK